MKYLFFIMLTSAGCRDSWRPKPVIVETPKIDSTFVVDTDSTKLNLALVGTEKFYFIGIRADTSLWKRVTDSTMLDSLVKDAKDLERTITIYGEPTTKYPEFEELINALKRRELYKFNLITDDKLKELRVEK